MPALALPLTRAALFRPRGAVAAGGESAAARATRYGLISAWNLDGLTDSYGSNTLTNNNTATFAAGKLGNAVSVASASSQYLDVADNASLSVGDNDFWGALWVNATTLGADRGLIGKDAALANGEWRIDYVNATPRFRFFSYKAGTVDSIATANTLGAPSTGVWIFLMFVHDKVTGVNAISANGGAFDNSAALTGASYDSTASLQIGRSYSGSPIYWNGLIDAFAYGKSPAGGIAGVQTEIRDYLYNSGTGREYPGGWT